MPITEIKTTEMHVSDMYIRNVFLMVRKHIRREGLYFKVDEINGLQTVKYILRKYECIGKNWIVELNKHTISMQFSCLKLELSLVVIFSE